MLKNTHLPKIAAVQMCSSDNIDANLEAASQFIHQASASGARLAVLPENFAFMGINNTNRLQYKEEFGHGKIQNFLAKLAKENKIWIVAGTIPMTSTDPQKVRAACLVYNEDGAMVARYDKIHLFDAIVSTKEVHKESQVVEPGNEVVVLETPIGKLGLAVCFDIRFPALFSQLLAKGAEMIAIPSAFTVPTGKAHWSMLTRCRAIDTFSYLIGANQGGLHTSGRKTYGHSIIVDPWGVILSEKNDDQPGIILSEVDLKRVYHCRESIPISTKSSNGMDGDTEISKCRPDER